MMADFMGNNISHGKIARRLEFFPKLPIEA
ncbi:Uncharacterised protein [Mycobacteroides abscessus subsp. abscessus]|nr:Uncharacterised protein [Mycobacteroides abscessus subsp. abscessus]